MLLRLFSLLGNWAAVRSRTILVVAVVAAFADVVVVDAALSPAFVAA